MKGVLKVSSSPHIRHIDTTSGIMRDVVIALIPASVYGCLIFGASALRILLTCIFSAVLSEFVWNKLLKKHNSVFDFSAVVTGLLLGLNLPPHLPLWIAAIGSIVAIIVVKQMFGGIGCNFVNPAISARIVLLVSFPSIMTKYYEPIYDTLTSATPLVAENGTYSLKTLFFGMHSGCIGETSAFLLLVGGLYLVIRRVISPIIPTCFIATFGIITAVTGGNCIQAILSGGVMIGAIFMATDYTTSPTTAVGKVVFGIGCGFITFVIRKYGAMPDGVSYAILLMNILVPYINRFTLSKPFGFVSKKRGLRHE